jgi:hypothetical protein
MSSVPPGLQPSATNGGRPCKYRTAEERRNAVNARRRERRRQDQYRPDFGLRIVLFGPQTVVPGPGNRESSGPSHDDDHHHADNCLATQAMTIQPGDPLFHDLSPEYRYYVKHCNHVLYRYRIILNVWLTPHHSCGFRMSGSGILRHPRPKPIP